MAKERTELIVATSAEDAASRTMIDAEDYVAAQRDPAWQDFCAESDSYVAQHTRMPALQRRDHAAAEPR